jgi:competence protein ComEC
MRHVPPLLAVTGALLLGQVLIGGAVALPLTLVAIGCALGAIGLGWGPTRLAAAMLFAFVLGNWTAARVVAPDLDAQHVATVAAGRTAHIEGRLRDDPERAPHRTRLRLDVERIHTASGSESVHGRVLVTIRRSTRTWFGGDRIHVALQLRRPRNFGNPGEFDYEAYLARHGVYVTAFLPDDARIELVERPASTGALAAWRRRVGALIDQHLPDPERGLLRALIIGDTASVAREVQDAFVAAGVSHVLSISGLHIGMVAAFGYLLWRWILARSRWLLLRGNVPKLAVAASVVPVLLYAGIAGGNTATVRSVLMVLVFLGAVLVDRQRDLLVSLAVAALIISLATPGAVLDISFQLSFVAVLALVLTMERFWPWWREWEERHLVRLRGGWLRLARPIAAYFAVSIAALAATTPLTAFHFNRVSVVALIANAVVVPLLGTAAVALGLLAALSTPLSHALATLWIWAAWPCLWLGARLVTLFAELPSAALHVVTPSLFELALIYAGLLTLLLARGRSRRLALGLIAVLALGDVAWWGRARFLRPDLRITFLSVGQGDSAVIECPGRTVIVVDGGGLGDGSFDVGERLIAPVLWRRKIARIDTMVMSHPQWDHFGGLTYLARHFRPREFWENGDHAAGVRFAALEAALLAAGTRRVVARPGLTRSCGDGIVRVLAPSTAAGSINDRSVVLQLERGGTRVLFTGDIERDGEHALLASTDGRLASQVVKVPHHGSATSSAPRFVAAVAPQLAVASLGIENRFGFPHGRVVQTYRDAGSTFLRTDRDGAVIVTIARDGTVAWQTVGRVP